jgi:hypothetical protein
LLGGDPLHPLDNLALESFGDREMGHAGGRRGAMQVLLAPGDGESQRRHDLGLCRSASAEVATVNPARVAASHFIDEVSASEGRGSRVVSPGDYPSKTARGYERRS